MGLRKASYSWCQHRRVSSLFSLCSRASPLTQLSSRWLVLEPFIVPGMFEPFNSDSNDPTAQNNAIDEWTLCEQLGSNLTTAMTEHYDTFIVSCCSPSCLCSKPKLIETSDEDRLRKISLKSPLLDSTGFEFPSDGGQSRLMKENLTSRE